MAATHRDLEQLVADRVFRHDLLARLDGLTLVISPLRQRVDDIPLLITITGPPVELSQEQEDHRQELVALLREHHGNLSAVARVLGKGRTQVVRWIERYRLDLGLFRGD